ncbi:MAG TPA: Ig-like domain repeat protein, partial [Solirubrobacteraceae bacterium]|nr:Ig-like domain repeat protein [Solirubrobacteraceae bacterium]
MFGPRLALAMLALAAVVVLGREGSVDAPRAAAPAAAHSAARDLTGAAALTRLRALPLAAQAAISGSLGESGAAFAASRVPGGFALRGGGLSASVAGSGALITAAGGLLSLDLAGVGRGSALRPVAVTGRSARGNRVTLAAAGGVREWFAGGPLGVEQGFTLTRRPVGAGGDVVVEMRTGGSLRPRGAGSQAEFVDAHGAAVARYGGLSVLDARGRRLAARIAVSGRRLSLIVADANAVYPLRIDPLVEQTKIVAGDESRPSSGFGSSLAISQDGTTALIGSPGDNSSTGAVSVFVRSGSTWTEQTRIPAPSNDLRGSPSFGHSVALSADGSTALIGGPSDNGGAGAAWVFTRSGTVWSEQQKIATPTDKIGVPAFGFSVALSADGGTALVGGFEEKSDAGAAWVFTRSGTTWTEQQKIAAPGDETGGQAAFGWAVALSSDGSTGLIGGPQDSGDAGAAWVFARSGTAWTEQQKIAKPGDATASLPDFGTSVALSADGSTALIGGPNDSGGAAWVFTRSGTAWAEQQRIATPTDETGGPAQFGFSVALSADGSSALIGGSNDTGLPGAAWVFTRSGTTWTEQQKISGPADETPGETQFGLSVALSADGSTALIGGPDDDSFAGAAWAFTRSGSTWSEQRKFRSPDVPGNSAQFGFSVALSSDGSSALIGGPNDDSFAGAAWVFTRSGSTWAEQQKIAAPADEIGGQSEFGWSVALSSDGSTALIGGPQDKGDAGAAWVFTRSGTAWAEQQKIASVAEEIGDEAAFGSSVALSSDGSTALIGGPFDNVDTDAGAAWVFTRSGSTWTEQQEIGAPADESGGESEFGWSVALSADGSTALIGGFDDNADTEAGAAWVFTRSGSTWAEQQKLAAGDEVGGSAEFGYSVALSADGSTALIGGPFDDSATDAGAAWVFTRSGTAWFEQQKLAVGDEVGGSAEFGYSVALSADGSTALIGGPFDNVDTGAGAAWVFTRAGTAWSEQQKIVAPGDEVGGGQSEFGASVAFSGDRSTALIGGPVDSFATGVGAAWVFTTSSTSTSVACSGAVVNGVSTCTATVSGGGGGTPSGSVSFSLGSGSGSFGSLSCSLVASGTEGVASCGVSFTPSQAGSDLVWAAYGGDAGFAGSSGSTTLVVAAPVIGASPSVVPQGLITDGVG